MKIISNKDGIALVTSLLLTLISLTIVMALFYMITMGIQSSAQTKKYRTALDAAYGGSEILLKDVMPVVLQNYSSATLVTTVQSAFTPVNLQLVADKNCFQAKLVKPTAGWPAGCNNVPDPKKAPDMTFRLQGASGNPFIVYSKIVDTIGGNSDTSGLQLEGSGVAESSSVLTPQHFPYIYRMEVQGERESTSTAPSTAQANIEVLYAY